MLRIVLLCAAALRAALLRVTMLRIGLLCAAALRAALLKLRECQPRVSLFAARRRFFNWLWLINAQQSADCSLGDEIPIITC